MATTTVATQSGRRLRPRLARALWIGAAILVALLVVGYVGISTYAISKLSTPNRIALVGNPSDYGMTSYQDVQFNSTVDNISLSGWLVDSPGNKVVIMLHGRGGNRTADESLEKAAVLNKANYDVLMFDFRGHGMSGGDRYDMGPWETRDLAGAINFLKGKGYSEFGVYGISMGAGTALLAAPDHPEMKALLIDSAYTDLQAVVERALPKDGGLPDFFTPGVLFMGKVLYGIDFSQAHTDKIVPTLGDRPIFQVHSRDGDARVPIEQANALKASGANDPNFSTWFAPGAGHVDAFPNNRQEYASRMVAFFDKYLK